MKRHLAPLGLLTLLAAGCGSGSDSSGGSNARPNVILISLDTTRADSMGFLGAPRPTPHLDRLASESAVFEDCMAQSSATAPSHMSILTGHTVQRHGLSKNGETRVPVYTIASLLKGVGYNTAAFTGHGSFQRKFGHGQGFDVFLSWDESKADDDGPFQRKFEESIPEALHWLDQMQDEGPFFLVVHGYDPHMPFWPEEPRRTEFAGWYDGDLDIENVRKRTEFHPIIAEGLLGADERRYIRDLYDAEIAAADEEIGGFLDELRRRGLYDTSLIVFTSDHGELLGEHDWVGHGQFFDEVAHVPLVIRFPGGKWAGRHTDPVQHIDILPTILANTGVAEPDGVQGLDLTPVIQGTGSLPADRMLVAQRAGEVLLRFADAPNLTLHFKQTGSNVRDIQVYDRTQDPDEARNLSDDPAVQARFRELYQRFAEWTTQSAQADDSYRGELQDIQQEDVDMLRALGYMGDDEELGE